MAAVTVTRADFGKLPDGRAVDVYALKNADLDVGIATYGARIVWLKTRDRDGKVADVVLGYKSVDGYVAEGTAKTYFGSIVGRYGNRIRTGKEVPGGVEMSLLSKDGDMGFPGTLTVHVRYTLVDGSVQIVYSATTDKPTVTNITNHSYFNLSGEGSGTILDEVLMLNADEYTPVDAGLIPVGGPKPVEGTPFDFRKPTPIGARIDQPNEQLKIAGGYDHNWVLNGKNGEMKLAAKLYDPKSGRVLTVTTTQPGVQFYSGNFLNGSFKGNAGVAYSKNTGLCLETQHYPDSPNQPDFPSTLLKPGETMHSTTVFTFSTQK